MPAPVPPNEKNDATGDLPEALPVLDNWVRVALLGVAGGLLLVFAIALWLNPYREDGAARRMETHRQLGLPPCNFKTLLGIPCPSCGMTTSFALLFHGDVANSLRANAVGTLLALFGLCVLPWCVASAWQGRTIGVRSLDGAVLWTVTVFIGLMLLRWIVVLAATLWS